MQKPLVSRTPQIVSIKASSNVISITQRARVSLTETYSVATTCRAKLGKEANRADHELRRLVGHANMLDTLMEALMEAEREQEGRINALLRGAAKPQQLQKIRWIDTIAEELEEDNDSDSDNDSTDDSNDERKDNENFTLPSHMAKSPPPKPWTEYLTTQDDLSDDDDDDEDDDVDECANDAELTLQRWPSKLHVPALTHDGDDSDSESEDEDIETPMPNRSCLFCYKKHSAIAAEAASGVKALEAVEAVTIIRAGAVP